MTRCQGSDGLVPVQIGPDHAPAGSSPRRGRYLRALVLAAAGLMLALAWAGSAAAEQALPRKVIVLYNSVDPFRDVYRHLGLPLNWLGLVAEFHDAARPLPPVWQDPDVLGVVSWFQSATVPQPARYVDWALHVLAAGRRLVVIGDIGVAADKVGTARLAQLYRALGLVYGGDWQSLTYDARVVSADPAMIGFERPLGELLPAFELFTPVDRSTRSLLVVRRPTGSGWVESHLAVITRTGGFVAPGYSHTRDPEGSAIAWIIDPFRFLEQALDVAARPMPDTTTLSGRRIYYSHIDGDGWLNRSLTLEKPPGQPLPYSSEVVRRRAIAAFPDLPVTVAPIAAELDPAWVGTAEAQQVARALFALPQVEPASHTYSHPFQWSFFQNYTPAKEAPYADRYRAGFEAAGNDAQRDAQPAEDVASGLRPGYTVPRAYANEPFDLDKEIRGAADYISSFAPAGKRVGLIHWSGDTEPFEAALAAARKAGLANINGGDSRYDDDFPSVSFLAPVGRRVGHEVQVYASSSNENTYTDLWTGRYFGFRDLVTTLKNSEQPRRLKPIDLYYHMYSGEKLASLKALLDNLAYIRRQEICPIWTSRYARLVQGFFTVRLTALDKRTWRVDDRGELQTLRFGKGDAWQLDLGRSVGVLGERRALGQLYVALDPAVPAPVVALRPREPATPPGRPFLIQSRWELSDLSVDGNGFAVTGQGFGPGEMAWRVPATGRYRVEAGTERQIVEVGADLRLAFSISGPTATPVRLRVQRQAGPP